MNKTIFSLLPETLYRTSGGLIVARAAAGFAGAVALDSLVEQLDSHPGVLLSSGTQVPGRYESFDLGFADPPLRLQSRGERFAIDALNRRGEVLIAFFAANLRAPEITIERADTMTLAGTIRRGAAPNDEELRTRRASILSLVRAMVALMASPEDSLLGLYGAFAYDLVFQLEDLVEKQTRAADQRDIVLYLPDCIMAYDRAAGRGVTVSYEFSFNAMSTKGLERATAPSVYCNDGGTAFADHAPGDYQKIVATAKESFACGDLFEAVPGQLFGEPCARTPAEVFRRLARINPAPYGALMNLGYGEFLVAASPEMFVRCDGRRVETCPISGTIARGRDAIGDAEQIRQLLNSQKDEFELNMCTDVDRNDKARICMPGSIKVLARRQIETYSKLFHTVDHVEGVLRPGFDSLDAFLTHAWAVTVTGAPKLWAMQFIEDHEKTPRRWYGGAIGVVGFDGSINTGITIRTIRMKDGVAEVRVGATLLYDSDPVAEEKECETKAAALFQALRGDDPAAPLSALSPDAPGSGRRVLLIDHEDSFVHMLADYFRQVGATVTVTRHSHARAALDTGAYDLVVLSPGPGRPEDFAISKTIEAALAKRLPIFGVCLGMQAIGEYFGGRLDQLAVPAHGRPSRISVSDGRLTHGLPAEITIGRYHSLHVAADAMPAELRVCAATEDGIVMTLEHRTLPVGGVQFHPESLMSLGDGVGLRIIENAIRLGAN